MTLKWDQIIPTLNGCEANARLKSAASAEWTLEGKLSLEDREYLLFVMEKEPKVPLPERAFAEITVMAARGILRGNGVMVRRSPRHLQVMVSGGVEVVQRRGHYRFSLEAPIILVAPNGKEELAHLVDLSISGGRVESATAQEKGKPVQVRIEKAPQGDLVLTAMVRSATKNTEGKWYLGLEWNLSPEMWEQVKLLLLAVMEKQWPSGGFVPVPRPQGMTEESLVKRAENAKALMAQIVDLLLKGQSNPDYSHEVIRLSTAVIQEVAAIGQKLKRDAG